MTAHPQARMLGTMAQNLHKLAQDHKIAVVMINQVTTKLDGEGISTPGDGVLAPALGDTWAHAANTRIMLTQGEGEKNATERHATLIKSNRLKQGHARYSVLAVGIRDVPVGVGAGEPAETPALKRPRVE